ncbi:unnamed protein product [Arctogadus glacialis]
MGCWSGLLLMDMILQGSVFQWQFTLTTYEGSWSAKVCVSITHSVTQGPPGGPPSTGLGPPQAAISLLCSEKHWHA